MKKMKQIFASMLAFLLVTVLLPLGNITVLAKGVEADDSWIYEIQALRAGSYKVGDIIKFGHYEQDGNTENGKEDIEWQVLKVESDRVLVVSKYTLDCQRYNTKFTGVTWETCTLRKWLNEDFKNAAFTDGEQKLIPTVNIANQSSPKWGTSGGNNTDDQIFCLSLEEAETYFGEYNWYDEKSMFGYNQNLICAPTQYAINNGAYVYTITETDYETYYKNHHYTSDVIGLSGSNWWFRSPPGLLKSRIGLVYYGGFTGAFWNQSVNCNFIAVRPALYINTSSDYPMNIKLDKTSVNMIIGNEMTLSAILTPEDAKQNAVTWSSSNPAVASVSNGVVKAKSVGKAIITATTVNGLSAGCEVAVLADTSSIFADIKTDSWMYAPAKEVYDKGYMTGTGTLGGKVVFSPNTEINRSQFVQALYSMDGKPFVIYIQKFNDVKRGDWFASAVTWAANKGITTGYPDGAFGVNAKATREQLALMFYNYAQYKKYDVSVKESTNLDGFKDADQVDSWALTAVKWAVERGIISGKGNASEGYRLDPTGKASRVECAAMMNTFCKVYSGDLKIEIEDLEEPLALPDEEIEDLPVPGDEIEDIIDDEDTEDEEDKDVIDDEDTEDEEDEDIIDEEDTEEEEDEDVIDDEDTEDEVIIDDEDAEEDDIDEDVLAD